MPLGPLTVMRSVKPCSLKHAVYQAIDPTYRTAKRTEKFKIVEQQSDDLRELARDYNVLCLIDMKKRFDIPIRPNLPWILLMTDIYGLEWYTVCIKSHYIIPWLEGLRASESFETVPYITSLGPGFFNTIESVQKNIQLGSCLTAGGEVTGYLSSI